MFSEVKSAEGARAGYLRQRAAAMRSKALTNKVALEAMQ
jgi:hypothetical protein